MYRPSGTTRFNLARSSFNLNSETPKKYLVLNPKNVKRINRDQWKSVAKLISEETHRLFGEIDSVQELIMTHFLTMGIEDDHGHLAGVMTIHNCPNVPALPTGEFGSWLTNLYGLSDSSHLNTFWIHFLCFDPKYEMFFAKPIIHHAFKFLKRLDCLFLVLPPGVNQVECLEEFSTRLLPKECKNPMNTQSLYQIHRDKFMISYKIRRAVEEDNDDLVPLIDLYSKQLAELYGNYYIAEILTRHKDSGRHIIVAEYEGSAVSVAILNETVNYDLLNEQFQLTPFNGLRQKSEDDSVDLESINRPEIIMSIHDITEDTDLERLPKGVFAQSFEDEDDYLLRVAESESDYSLVFTTSDIFVFDEYEEEEKESVPELRMGSESDTSLEILKQIEKVKAYEVDPRLTYADMMDRLSRSLLSTRSKIGKLPKFFGKGNAFCLEVAAAHPDHEVSLFHVLEAVFECFPDRDYCIICIPTNSKIEHWMGVFNRVAAHPNSNFPNDLYVCHKNSLLGTLECCVATKEHMDEVFELLNTIPTHTIVLSHFEISLEFEDSPYYCFVFLCEGQVIGTAVLSEEYNIDYIDAQYDISPFVPLNCYKSGSFGVVESMVISPVFHNAGSFFIRELLRLSEFHVLFYKYKWSDRGTYKERPIMNLLNWLQPILPRQIPEYDFKNLAEEGYPANDTLIRKDNYALYVSTISQSSMPRIVVNTRIVVVGCSNTAYAFLESLILRQTNTSYKCVFNNVTLICTDGSHSKLSKKVKELFVVQKNYMSEKYMDLISLKTYINVVRGNLTQIDRKENYVIIDDQSILRYDLLFLMCGERFQKPLQEYRMPFAENPSNVFIINCPADSNKAIIKLKELQTCDYYRYENIVVYGHYLQAYNCLAGLLEYGISGSSIVLVEPFPYSMNIDKKRRHNISFFNDPDIYQATMEYIAAQGIQVYSSYYFINWTYSEEENMVTNVKFESKHKMLEMSCQAIFFFYEKSISPKTYQVINRAGLVFDGRLVVDSNCRTNDENIYGAGTLTKYSRRYFALNMVHKFFNRIEIGTKLGQQIRNMLIPGFVRRCETKRHSWNFHLDIRDRLVPKYENPIMRYCRLPGGLYYLSIVKPGRRIPLEIASCMENYGQAFITGSCKNLDQQGFFKLHFNEYNRVETITCLTKFPIPIKNMYCLWGKHEKLLNNLHLQFEMYLISDFFEYFKQPWTYAIYHDRFDPLINELNNIMTSAMEADGCNLLTNIIEMYIQRKWQPLTFDQQDTIEETFPNMLYPRILEQKVLDFIQENLNYLPMYAHPVVVRNILEGFDKSPLFPKQKYNKE